MIENWELSETADERTTQRRVRVMSELTGGVGAFEGVPVGARVGIFVGDCIMMNEECEAE